MSSVQSLERAVAQARAKRDALEDEIHKLGAAAEAGAITDAQAERLDRQTAAHARAKATVIDAEAELRAAKVAEIKQLGRDGNLSIDGDRGGSSSWLGSSALDEARRSIDNAHAQQGLPDDSAELATRLVTEGSTHSQRAGQQWAIATGSDEYRSAFAKMVMDPDKGHLLWTAAEQQAYRDAQQWAYESRTVMSLTDAAGGYLTIPLTLDPAIRLTNAGSISPLRQLANVVTTTTDTWRGVTSAGATSEWKAENVQAAAGDPALGNVDIPVILSDTYCQYSVELGMDAENFLDHLLEVMIDSLSVLQNTAFTTGAGTTEPFGIVTGLIGGSSELNSVSSEAFTAADVYALQNALGARFSQNASWLANIAKINQASAFETTSGALQFPELRETPPHLLRKPVFELSHMDGVYDAAATANNYILIYGDIHSTFTIVDRIGSTFELIPHVMGANYRPIAARGALLYNRVGSKVVNASGARILDIPTTA